MEEEDFLAAKITEHYSLDKDERIQRFHAGMSCTSERIEADDAECQWTDRSAVSFQQWNNSNRFGAPALDYTLYVKFPRCDCYGPWYKSYEPRNLPSICKFRI